MPHLAQNLTNYVQSILTTTSYAFSALVDHDWISSAQVGSTCFSSQICYSPQLEAL